MSSELLTIRKRAELPAAPKHARRRRGSSHTSLSAHGEPMVWLTGGALAIALLMIVTLLAHVFWTGARTFWPGPVVQLELLDGTVLMGEPTEVDSYRAEPAALEALAANHPDAAAAAERELSENSGQTTRRQIRIGNFEITGEHFAWVPYFLVKPDGLSQPEWAIVMERLAWGRFYGFPNQFILSTPISSADEARQFEATENKSVEVVLQDGSVISLSELPADAGELSAVREIWNDAPSVWAQFQQYHDECRERWQQRIDLQKHELGELNRERNDARLDVIEIELNYGEHSPEYAAAQQQYEDVVAATTEQAFAIEEQIRQLDEENSRFQLVMATASGQTQQFAVADIVRAYPANQLGLADKIGVYLSRWGEFLTDVPREANSEGGVFPAIWGTVAMTMLMSVLVVPFGVLAALYLREYAKAGPVVSAVRIAINNLAGVPSIVFGVFGLGFFCYNVGHFIDVGPADPWRPPLWWSGVGILLIAFVAAAVLSAATAPQIGSASRRTRLTAWIIATLWIISVVMVLLLVVKTPYFDGLFRAKYVADNKATYGTGGLLWASLTLALLTLPVVIVATEEALAAVPGSMREGSYACGASKWQTIRRIVLPRAMPGIMTGMILAMARGAGEVAPLMLVGVLKLAPELPLDSVFPFIHPERSFMHLGFHIYDVGFQSQNSEAAKPMVYTTTLLLVGIIALLNIAAIALRTRLRRRFVASQF